MLLLPATAPLHPIPEQWRTVSVRSACLVTESGLVLQNELAILEFIHCLVETLDRYFSNVCELDLMFNLEMVRAKAQPCFVFNFRFLSRITLNANPHDGDAGALYCG